ncbi:hypothetical protein DEU31_3036 [Brachybacterium sp. AG952]|uniref:hypothetical protein n=1 Tax=Brachybacterium sp. AG952 TaxID=2183989 RepID=UPI00105C1872|nr:hypothetical protein [Brachybacterium sp. AG952]TDP76329.1 hypothetical protein DEU31_3036 [Brachybacterium sp. AG952]
MTAPVGMSHAEVQQLRQAAVFEGTITRDQAQRLAQSWLEQHHALARVREVHAPIDAVDEHRGARRKVCAGCGTDAGAWQVWPCSTIRAVEGGGIR